MANGYIDKGILGVQNRLFHALEAETQSTINKLSGHNVIVPCTHFFNQSRDILVEKRVVTIS